MSSQHASIRWVGDGWELKDLGSRNGTAVDGVPVPSGQVVKLSAGMSVSFTSSLFGLAGSLVLGFLDLQASQAQSHFYTELEDFLASHAEMTSAPSVEILHEKPAGFDPLDQRKSAAALANLAEGIQGLVAHMRQEQQLIRDWVEAQASQQEEVRKLLERLAREHETR